MRQPFPGYALVLALLCPLYPFFTCPGETCHAIYDMTATGLGPEIVDFQVGADATPHNWKYILRPEAAETWFYLWRYTQVSFFLCHDVFYDHKN